MNSWTLILGEALLFILAFSLLSQLRKEGFPLQLAYETLGIALVAIVIMLTTGRPFDPILFLVVTYLLVMRTRLAVDLGNLLARQGHHQAALALFDLALRLKPDGVGRTTALINAGVSHVRGGDYEQAISTLERVLQMNPGSLVPRYEAASRYNLGVAYEKAGRIKEAMQQYRQVIQVFPDSLYAKGAREAMKRAIRARTPREKVNDGET